MNHQQQLILSETKQKLSNVSAPLSPQPRRNSKFSKSSVRFLSIDQKNRKHQTERSKSISDFSPRFEPQESSHNINLSLEGVHSEQSQTETSPSHSDSSISILERFISDTQHKFSNDTCFEAEVEKIIKLISPCSKSSLEISLCLREAKNLTRITLEELGPHKNGLDLMERFGLLCINKTEISGRELLDLFISENSGFYDYYYLRLLEAVLKENFTQRSDEGQE